MINFLSPMISIIAVLLSIVASVYVFKITNEELED